MLRSTVATLCALAATAAHAVPTDTLVDFENGRQGWQAPNSLVHARDDFDGKAYHTKFEHFGLTYANSTNDAFLGDYGTSKSVTIGLDINAFSVVYFNTEVSRDLIVELRDYDSASGGYPWTSVWFNLGTIQAGEGWKHLEVTIEDTSSTVLPSGWGGYGAETDDFLPVLPDGVTFADVLSGVDEIAFSTLVPGYVYGFTYFDVAVDNISISAVPEPGTLAMTALGLAALGLRRRQR